MFEDVFRVNYKVVKKELIEDGQILNVIGLDLSDLINDIEDYIKKDHVKIKTIQIKGWKTNNGITLNMDITINMFIGSFLGMVKSHGFLMVGYHHKVGLSFIKSIKAD